MNKTNKQRYEAPRAEVIEIESQGVLCASGTPQTGTGATGNGGITFGTDTGSW